MTTSAERILSTTSEEETAVLFGESYAALPENDPMGLTPEQFGEAVLTRALLSEQERAERVQDLARETTVPDAEIEHSLKKLVGVVRLVAPQPLLASIGHDILQKFEHAHLDKGGDPELLDGDTIDRGRTSHFA
jgi:hypothetical protein